MVFHQFPAVKSSCKAFVESGEQWGYKTLAKIWSDKLKDENWCRVRKLRVPPSRRNTFPEKKQKHCSGKNKPVKLVRLVLMDEQIGGVRGSVSTLGSIYAITKKQNINRTMFGLVKKQTCISKRSPRTKSTHPHHKRVCIKITEDLFFNFRFVFFKTTNLLL